MTARTWHRLRLPRLLGASRKAVRSGTALLPVLLLLASSSLAADNEPSVDVWFTGQEEPIPVLLSDIDTTSRPVSAERNLVFDALRRLLGPLPDIRIACEVNSDGSVRRAGVIGSDARSIPDSLALAAAMTARFRANPARGRGSPAWNLITYKMDYLHESSRWNWKAKDVRMFNPYSFVKIAIFADEEHSYVQLKSVSLPGSKPMWLWISGVEGAALVRASVDTSGAVIEAHLEHTSSERDIDSLALASARTAVFWSMLGAPIPSEVLMLYVCNLTNESGYFPARPQP